MRVLAARLAVLLVADQLLILFARDLVAQFYQKPIPAWVPTQIIGPFLAYEIVALLVLRYRLARGSPSPTTARFANALIETSLPTVSLWWVNKLTTPALAFGTWPTMLYFIFIVSSTAGVLGIPFRPAQSEGTAMAKGVLIAAMDFSNVAEDEFNDWYDTEHIPERQRVPGFLLSALDRRGERQAFGRDL
jgi:hypothetical protein